LGNKPEAILIGDHGLSCLLAEKLSLRDMRLLQQYLPIATNAPPQNVFLFGHLFALKSGIFNRDITT